MSNVVSRGGVIARLTSGNVVPIIIVPEAPDTGDCTATIAAALAALPATGGALLFEGKRYATNTIVAQDGVTFIMQGGGGDGNVATGFVPFDDTKPALQLGDGVTQRRGFRMFGGRIYSQTNQFGLLITGMADFDFFGTEIGAFTKYAMRLTSGAAANTYFGNFIGCKFFGNSGMTTTGSRIIDLLYGAGFTTTIHFIGGNLDGSAIGGLTDFTGPCAMSIGSPVEVRCQGFNMQLRHAKGVRIAGTGRFHASSAILDTSDTPSTAVLVEIPSTELYPNSFVIGGDLRINGCMRNTTPTVVDLRGNNQFGHGFEYSPKVFEPDILGWFNLIPTFQQTGVRITPIGGSPEGSLAGNAGDIAISVNNTGSSNSLFVKSVNSISADVTKGWLRVATGDYFRQTAGLALASAATTDILHDTGDFNFVSGTATITSLGTDANVQSGLVRRIQATGAFTLTHTASPTGGQVFLLGQENITVVAGDVMDFLWQGAASGWRMVNYRRFDGRPFLPGRRTWAPQVAHNLIVKPPQASSAGLNTLSGTSTPAETFDTWDFDQTLTEYLDIQGILDHHLTNGGLVVTLLFMSTATSGNGQFRGCFRKLGGIDLDTTAFNYVTSNISSGAVAVNGTTGIPSLATLTFPNADAALNGVAAGDSFNLRIWRDTGVASNAAADLRVLENSIRIAAL